DFNGVNKRILEFGCFKSYLAIELATIGYDVTGIDLRDYSFKHPNLRFFKINILNYMDEEKFDYITSISTIEHIGLGYYDQNEKGTDLNKVCEKLVSLLKDGGKLIFTVPVGMRYQDHFLRSFTRDEVINLFKGHLELVKETYFRRYQNYQYWIRCGKNDIKQVSNDREDCGPFGVNGIGCYVWKKK
ncbi:MAG: methyltransferase domain-containing protein, partial [Candidatus Lokiarchaeota archaeon]|nr:methyltransferase domain-containing protein [Candidatus Lokiarchaeota archaeon]